MSHSKTSRLPTALLSLAACLLGTAFADETSPELDPAELEAQHVVIGAIVLEKEDVFDLSDPKEDKRLYRLANKLHILTKDSVILDELLFKEGDEFSQRLVDETARILRANSYFYDVEITPKNRQDGTVDLHVNTHDVWTLKPGFSYSRSGGENRSLIKIEELNLFGRGQQIFVARSKNVDRESKIFTFRDKNIGSSRAALRLNLADNSDGHSSLLSLERPFYALDTRWAAGASAFDEDSRSVLYELGEEAAEYRHERRYFSAFRGWSAGLNDGWVRRYSAGIVSDDNQFSNVIDATLPAAIPESRKFVYPYFAVELLQDRFETTVNRDQIKKTEDFLTGTRFTASLGWASEGFGADRDSILYSLSVSRLFGELAQTALVLSANASGRHEAGTMTNALVSATARYYHQQSEKRTFFATLSTTLGDNLDLDNPVQLGGDSGLRGYPLRYQSGDSKILLTLEQRYFWDWYPFRLFRVGGAIFADAGRTWGENPLGSRSLGWLSDVGIGLRFASTRTGTRSIVHLDIAFPMNGDSSIDSVQVLLESKKSF